MPDIGYGYGSQWHLLRYLGYHRTALDNAIVNATGGQHIQWLDFLFNPRKRFCDDEWKGLDFLKPEHPARKQWPAFWPTTGNVPNWDAVGRLEDGTQSEWLLIEAKANVDEIRSSCGAKEEGGLPMIRSAFEVSKQSMGIGRSGSWLTPFYQYANRLSTLDFLLRHDVPGRLVFIYFLGDQNSNAKCPDSVDEWQLAIQQIHAHLGLSGTSEVEARTHAIFLHVCDSSLV